MKRIALFLAIAAAAIACTNEETVTPELKVTSETADLVIPTEGGELTVAFTVNVDWTAEVKEAEAKEWCSLSPASGKPGDNTLKVIALENEGTENRTVTVVLRALEATQEIVVTQLQKDALVLTGKKEFEVAYQGQNLEFAVSHNSELKATADVPWITEVKAKAVEESKLTFAVAANTGEARTGKITFEAGSLKEVVTVKQAAWALEFTVTPEGNQNIQKEGGDVVVTVVSNVEYEVVVSENEWLTMTEADGVYTFSAKENPSEVLRSAIVSITPKEHEDAAKIFKIVQFGSDPLGVTPVDDKWLDFNETTFELTVYAGVEFDVVYQWDREEIEPWISYVAEGETYTFTVAASGLAALRSAVIKFVPKDELLAEFAKSVNVFQNGHLTRLFAKEVKNIDGYDPAQKARLAKYGDKILLANTTKVFVLNPTTGEVERTIPMPDGVLAHSVLVDDADNLMIASDGKPNMVEGDTDKDGDGQNEMVNIGQDVTLYLVPDPLNPQPEPLLTWNTANYYGTDFGNFRVKGDVKNSAVITAVVSEGASGAAILWEVENGVVGDWSWRDVPYQATTVASACVYPMGPDLADGLLYIAYGGDYNLYYAADSSADWISSYVTGSTWMENYNCISTAEWNGNKYAAILMGCHFNYDMADAVLLDINEPSSAKQLYIHDGQNDAVWDWSVNANTSWTGSGTYSDILLVPTEDALLMYYVDSNYGTMAGIAVR